MESLHCPACGAVTQPEQILLRPFPPLALHAPALLLRCKCGVETILGMLRPSEQPAAKPSPDARPRQVGFNEPYEYQRPTVDHPQLLTRQELSALLKLRGRYLDEKLEQLRGA